MACVWICYGSCVWIVYGFAMDVLGFAECYGIRVLIC